MSEYQPFSLTSGRPDLQSSSWGPSCTINGGFSQNAVHIRNVIIVMDAVTVISRQVHLTSTSRKLTPPQQAGS